MLQKKGVEPDNTTLKAKMMARKNRASYQVKFEALEKAQAGLGQFLRNYASAITAADLATDEEEGIDTAADDREKMNTQAEAHLKGVRTCLKEANV